MINWEDSRALFADKQGTSFHAKILDKSLLLLGERRFAAETENVPEIVMEIDGVHQVTRLQALADAKEFAPTFHEDSRKKCRWVSLIRRDCVIAHSTVNE